MEKDCRVAVVGAGAVGGITAGFLSKNGYDVELVCKHNELAEKVRTQGIRVFGVNGDFHSKMKAVGNVEELSGPKDYVFLATKATDMLDAAKKLLPFLHERSAVVSLQNGICEEAIAEVVGKQRTIGCVVGWGATMHEPGNLEMTSTGEFVIGTINGSHDERLDPVRDMLSSVVPVIVSDNIIGNLYSKLIINSCITSLGAVCGLYLGEMLASRKIRNIFIQIMIEAMDVADKMKLNVEPYAGKLNYYTFVEGTGAWKSFKRHAFIRLIGVKYRRLKSSSLQSLERGKPTEIEYLNGYIVNQGAKFGIPVPVNEMVVKMVREIEGGKRKITPENFNDPFFSKFG